MTAVTIVGGGPSWKCCEFVTQELWGCLDNLLKPELEDKPYTKLFAFDELDGVYNGVVKHNEVLEKSLEIAHQRKIPVVSNREYADIKFPTREIAREFQASYFMPTISYMIALAVYENFSPIYIHGIDAGPQWYYQFGKPHIMFWLGVATGRKIQLRLGMGSIRWAYRAGLDGFPEAIIVDEAYKVGLAASGVE